MRRTAAFLGLLLAGCATAPGLAPTGGPPTQITPTSTGMEVRLRPDDTAAEAAVAAPVAEAWSALVAAYQALEIPIASIDEAHHLLGNRAFETSRRLDGKRISTYVSCGSDLSGPLADQGRVRLDLVTQLVPEGNATTIATRLQASVTPFAGTSASNIGCGSTGRLEARIAELVREQLAR